jgi:formate hydrogenlyase transcriptional activator
MSELAEPLIGASVAIRVVQEELEYAALSDAKVLLTGESGVGKEVVARLIHSKSRRSRAAFVTMNCAGVPESLLESELFGHVRGSFTGAFRDRAGLLEIAHHGTIFMDEVGEMSLRMQALLLRFLEGGEIQRVGADRKGAPVDVRVIAATNRKLMERIAAGAFREDLYYRLNVIHIPIPPLRERREDIPLLVRHFVQKYTHRIKKPIETIPSAAIDALSEHEWPGNVRELEHFIERAVILSPGSELQPPLSELSYQNPPSAIAAAESDSTTLREAEREHIMRTLKDTNWTIGGPAGAAARLGMKRTTLHSLVKRLGIDRPR